MSFYREGIDKTVAFIYGIFKRNVLYLPVAIQLDLKKTLLNIKSCRQICTSDTIYVTKYKKKENHTSKNETGFGASGPRDFSLI